MPPKAKSSSKLIDLSENSEKRLAALLLACVEYEEKIEVLRQFLVSNELFDLYGAFNRLDRNQDGFISPIELLNFFRDNGDTSVTEADCYYVIKYFDSDVDAKLHFPDFMQMCLPCTNARMRSEVSQRMVSGCNPGEFLSMDVEQDLLRLLQLEVEMHRDVEIKRQFFASMPDVTPDGTFSSLDSAKIGFLEIKSFAAFLKRLNFKLSMEELFCLMRRIEVDQDG